MIELPILINRDYKQVVGSVIIDETLADIYNETNYLVLNPVVINLADGDEEIVAFSIHPKVFEPEPTRKRKKKNAKSD